jgi:hypothetical protein
MINTEEYLSSSLVMYYTGEQTLLVTMPSGSRGSFFPSANQVNLEGLDRESSPLQMQHETTQRLVVPTKILSSGQNTWPILALGGPSSTVSSQSNPNF